MGGVRIGFTVSCIEHHILTDFHPIFSNIFVLVIRAKGPGEGSKGTQIQMFASNDLQYG